jgi:hypothetical protein
MDLGEGEAGEMRRTYTLAMLWAGLACSAVLMASQASAEPSLDQRPLRERIAAEDAKERAQDVASRAASTGHNKRLGNAIFLHPDGSGPAMWQAGRVYWKGPDENLFWDRLPYKAMYRGHANDLRSSGRKGLNHILERRRDHARVRLQGASSRLLRARRFAANHSIIGIPRQYHARGGEQGSSRGRGQ